MDDPPREWAVEFSGGRFAGPGAATNRRNRLTTTDERGHEHTQSCARRIRNRRIVVYRRDRFRPRHTVLNEPMYLYTSIGIAFFGVLIIAAWWKARREDSATMAAVVAAPIAAVAAYLVNDAVKGGVVEEPRPCNSYPTAFILEKCPPLADYSFPSNHTVVAAAVAAALFFVSWRWGGTVAAVAAALMAFSRVYVGAHYPPRRHRRSCRGIRRWSGHRTSTAQVCDRTRRKTLDRAASSSTFRGHCARTTGAQRNHHHDARSASSSGPD